MANVFLIDPTNALQTSASVVPQTVATVTSTVGTAVDCLGTEGPIHLHYMTGATGDATLVLSVKLQESVDTTSGNFADLSPSVTATLANASATAGDNLSGWLTAHNRTKRYVRAVVVTAGAGTLSVLIGADIVATKKIAGTGGGSYTGF